MDSHKILQDGNFVCSGWDIFLGFIVYVMLMHRPRL